MTDTPEFAKIRAIAQADRRVGACDTQEIARIRAALAAGPTPGPWEINTAGRAKRGGPFAITEIYVFSPTVQDDTAVCGDVIDPVTQEPSYTNAGYIAACNPAAMTALLAHIDAQADEVERLGRLIKAVQNTDAAAQPCPTCESLAVAVMMDQTAHDMNLVAEKYAHKLALDLECVLADYSGKWWDAAIKTIGDYRSAMNAIHERESPTFMGEPLL